MNTRRPKKEPRLPVVRAAIEADFAQLMALSAELYKENGALRVDWNRVAERLVAGCKQQGAVIGVIGDIGNIQGMIYLSISQLWYSGEMILEELFNFVPKEFRNGHNARALIGFAKDSAISFKVPLLIGVISNDRVKAKVNLYNRQLGEPKGAFYMFNVKRWEDVQLKQANDESN